MATRAVFLIPDEQHASSALADAALRLEGGSGEVVLEFSSVQRMDPRGLRALEQFADAADGKALKVVLRGVNITLYRTLKLVKLTPRFSFTSELF